MIFYPEKRKDNKIYIKNIIHHNFRFFELGYDRMTLFDPGTFLLL
jgi:hypothetical protein